MKFYRCSLRALALLLGLCSVTSLAAQSAQGDAARSGPASLREYRINPGDEVEIFVWGEERLQRSVRVLPDGTFSFPLVGKVNAVGKLPSEIETVVAAGLAKLYQTAVPQVTVSIRNPTGMQFSVIGKVRNPGIFTPGRYVNALEALSFAGGPTEFAKLQDILIIRKDGQRLRPLRVQLSNTLRGTPSETNLSEGGIPQLQSGDTVVVP